MDGSWIDRLARFLATSFSRRGLAALLVGTVAGFGPRVARGNQLGPATCGSEGAVCTLLSGCCDGFTCVTSAINTSYGVCVPGEGGMVSTGTTLISPHSETVVEEVTALVQAVPTSTVDPQAEREARIAELKARKDAKRSKRKTRLDTKRTTQQTRRDNQQSRRVAAREDAEEAPGPSLEFELINPGGIDGTETVKVRNVDDVNVLLTKIESVLNPDENNSTNRTVSPGGSFNYYSGIAGDISDADEQLWLNVVICSDTAGAGFRITAAFSSDSVNHEFIVSCDGPTLFRVNETPEATPRRKRKKSDDRRKRKKKKR